ncbi:hypothetical protein C8R26_11758 [Nitrosomonas oligotropha]|uniref:Uncharacterized protein n=1 Tax=Nitrosomonas oligotropha TaxID=42354 RepID=A0A2T5HY01_9PROT|nr:hypothetical protein [Nitrosomonas oligotropha]PTQ76465.1 hypothetical protein C8R26_11758 [Nitrosomonas oligotropha]
MGYRHKNLCLDTVEQLNEVVSADCPLITSDGSSSIKCTPSATDILITIDSIPTTGILKQQTYVPELISCDSAPAIADVIEVSWLVVAVWVTAWGIKKMADALKGRS